MGEVVTAEVGQLKKDIVHTGDAVNVAARIEGQCHALGARLLASEAALALAPLPDDVEAEMVGEVGLRGRAGVVRLYRVGPPRRPKRLVPSAGPDTLGVRLADAEATVAAGATPSRPITSALRFPAEGRPSAAAARATCSGAPRTAASRRGAPDRIL